MLISGPFPQFPSPTIPHESSIFGYFQGCFDYWLSSLTTVLKSHHICFSARYFNFKSELIFPSFDPFSPSDANWFRSILMTAPVGSGSGRLPLQ